MKRGWIVVTLCLMALFGFSIFLALQGSALLNSRPLAMKDTLGPGPGFFPVWLGILGVLLGGVLLLETSRRPAVDPADAELVPDRVAISRIIAVLVLLAAATASLDFVGYRITALAFTFLLLLALGARSPLVIIPFCLTASFGVFHVFYHWLKVPLPIGQLFGI